MRFPDGLLLAVDLIRDQVRRYPEVFAIDKAIVPN